MKYYSLGLLLGVAATMVAGQGIGDLPDCAGSCAQSGLASTGCNQSDFKCICSNTGFIESIGTCVVTKCSPADQEKTLQFAEEFCKVAGVEVPSGLVSSIESIAATATATTSSGSKSSTAPSAGTTGSSSTNSSSSSNTTVSGTASPTPTPTGNVGNKLATSVWGLGAAAAALLLL